MGNKAVKTSIGMASSYFFPFKTEPASGHPTYKEKIDMGAAVKGVLAVNTATYEIYGDDALLVTAEMFVSGQMDVETALDDLEVNAKLYGHNYAEGVETSNANDSAPNGGYAFIQAILKKDKTIVYRATFFHKTCAVQSGEKQEADTRKGGLDPKMNAVRLKVMKDNTGDWRSRQDCDTLAAAEAYIDTLAAISASSNTQIT